MPRFTTSNERVCKQLSLYYNLKENQLLLHSEEDPPYLTHSDVVDRMGFFYKPFLPKHFRNLKYRGFLSRFDEFVEHPKKGPGIRLKNYLYVIEVLEDGQPFMEMPLITEELGLKLRKDIIFPSDWSVMVAGKESIKQYFTSIGYPVLCNEVDEMDRFVKPPLILTIPVKKDSDKGQNNLLLKIS